MDYLSKRVGEKRLPLNGRILVFPMKTPDVVTIEGSVLGGWNYLSRSKQDVPALASSLYDAGTKKHSKKELRELLASYGATISFSSTYERTYFSASCFPEDISRVLSIIAECLATPLFAKSELLTVRQRTLSLLNDAKTNCAYQAHNALRRLLYDEGHVNYVPVDAERVRNIQRTVISDVIDYHTSYVGRGGLIIAITGDIDTQRALAYAERAFSNLPIGTDQPSLKKKNEKRQLQHEKRIHINRKTSIDLYMGFSVPVMLDDFNHLPLVIGTDMLGGGFAGHLMQTIRERDGLTYGIQAGIAGLANDVDGYFYIWSTFSPDLFHRGVSGITKELKKFFQNGITPNALNKKKNELAGSYAISLGTTAGMASKLHSVALRNKDVSYLDEYPQLVRATTLRRVKDAMSLIHPFNLSIAAAGTFKN